MNFRFPKIPRLGRKVSGTSQVSGGPTKIILAGDHKPEKETMGWPLKIVLGIAFLLALLLLAYIYNDWSNNQQRQQSGATASD